VPQFHYIALIKLTALVCAPRQLLRKRRNFPKSLEPSPFRYRRKLTGLIIAADCLIDINPQTKAKL
jgi:hypothetical protein